jgi:hypothetical protein
MWTEPYLETCCRAALHRLKLAGAAGRPAGQKDDPCLARLVERGLAAQRADGRYGLTEAGAAAHAALVARAGATAQRMVTPAAR